MHLMPDIKLTSDELNYLRENYFDYGGESHIVKSKRKNTVFKIFRDLDDENLTKERNEKKLQKVTLLYNKPNIKYNTRPLSTISVNGEFKGYELTYDPDDESLLLATITRQEKIEYLRKAKEILLYFESFGIIYGDIKSDNILINYRNGKVKFCDMDNIQIDKYPMDEMDCALYQFVENYGKIDANVHSFMHNLLTINELNYNSSLLFSDILKDLSKNSNYDFLSDGSSAIIKEMISPKENYTGKYLINYVKK